MTPLQVFEKHPSADAYRVGGFYSPHCLVATEKRFTTPELLAQYWFCEKMGHSPVFNALLWRFASLPHYDGTAE